MARPKEFDVDEALSSALDVFWRQGFEATSMQDLVAAMGIQKASLYGTFGDKRELYVRALRSYQQQSLRTIAAALAAGKSPKAAIRAFVLGVADQACSKLGKRGCFCVNANIELAPHDRAIGDLVHEHGRAVESLLEQALLRAKARRELREDADCGQLATFLFGVVISLNVLGKQAAGRERMTVVARYCLSALDR